MPEVVVSKVLKSGCASIQIIPRLLYLLIDAREDAIATLWSPPIVIRNSSLFRTLDAFWKRFLLNSFMASKFFLRLVGSFSFFTSTLLIVYKLSIKFLWFF